MKYLLLVYTDDALLDALSEGEYDGMMKHCLEHADELQAEGTLLGFQQLQPAATAKAVRIRGDKATVSDGPFAETKELLAGFNLVEANSMEHAIELARQLPWARTGCIEVRALRDVEAERRRVGAMRPTT